jgi:phage terminase small subunit
MPKPTSPRSTKEDRERERARAIADKYFDIEGEPVSAAQAEQATPGTAPEAKRLTPKEFQFCQEYIIDFNGTQAAIRAGYSKKTAAVIAYENLRKPHIARCITELMKERSRATKWTAEKLLQRLGDELEADLNDIHNPDGSLKPVADWPLVFRQGLVEGLKIREELTPDGELIVARIVEYKTASRSKLKEMIGKHVDVQAFKDKVEHDVTPPLQRLYEQLAGTGIRPMTPDQAPGLGLPPTKPANAIRPQEPDQQET